MSSASPYAELFEHLALGGLVVLPSARSARTLHSAFDRHQSGQAQLGLGPSAWEPARVLSWQQFTTGLFNDLVLDGLESRLLLNEAQEHHLWRETIAVAQPNALASTDSLAELARSAWHLASAYNATSRLYSTANTTDTRTFAAWAGDFSARCAKSQLLPLAQLDSALLTHLQRSSLPAPPSLHLAAFDDPTPSQSAVLEALRIRGSQIVHHPIEYPTQPFQSLRASIIAPTERDEFLFAARWIREFLRQHRAENQSVAVLLPSLDDDRAQLDLIFREILAPELESIHADLSSTPWEFSTGPALASLPLLHCVLELAHWANAALPLDRVSALLLSPFLGGASDRNLAAQFDAAVLRRSTLLRPELDLSAFLALADTKAHVASLPAWLRNFHLQVTRAGNLDHSRSFAEWAEFVRSLASAANWPGERTPTASEFEATRAWDSVLDLLSTLDSTNRGVSLSTFLESLDRQTRVTNFAGPSTHASVQVMSIEDAAGSAFDAVLFLRATDANWPHSPTPNPLLSWHLQQQLNMPGASAAASTAQARSLTTHLLARSGNTLFLSAAENVDGHLRPLALLEGHINSWPAIFPQPQLVSAPSILSDAFADASSLPAPSTHPRGGSKVLKLQAACGFLAFAELRLQSKELSPRAPGFDALESGNILHEAMRRFWQEMVSQDELRRRFAERDAILTQCIDATFASALPGTSSWDQAYLTLQKHRLHKVLRDWLNLELKRSPFTVTAREEKTQIEVGPLTLSVRVDRIDKVDLPDGNDGFVFVDYKTSYTANPKNWESPRPDDPQLPLYALTTTPNELKALTFAKIRAGQQAEWLGYQSTPGFLPIKTVPELPLKINDWRDALTQLAYAFYSGDASVYPKDFAQNCTRCAQRLVCRVNPADLEAQAELDDKSPDADGAADD
jgi:probable DNA repair protein